MRREKNKQNSLKVIGKIPFRRPVAFLEMKHFISCYRYKEKFWGNRPSRCCPRACLPSWFIKIPEDPSSDAMKFFPNFGFRHRLALSGAFPTWEDDLWVCTHLSALNNPFCTSFLYILIFLKLKQLHFYKFQQQYVYMEEKLENLCKEKEDR